MAQPTTGTPSTRGVGTANFFGGSNREDLADFITQLSPEQTPYLSSGIGSNKAMQPRHDWQTDELDNADIGNAQAESFEFSSSNALQDVPVRLQNYTQVFGKTIHVPGSLLKSNFAGAQDYFSYQRMKRGKEIMRDVELAHIFWTDVTGTSGANTNNIVYDNSGNTRRLGSLAAYARHWGNAASGSSAGLSTAVRGGTLTAVANSGGTTTAANFAGSDAAKATATLTDGSRTVHHSAAFGTNNVRQALREDMITDMAQQFTDHNGNMSHIVVPTGLKGAMSNALIAGNGGAAQRRADAMAKKVNLAVDMVVTEFGFDVSVVPNYLMNNTYGTSDNYAIFYDASDIKRSVLTPLDTDEDGTGRYGKGYIMYCDETIEVRNPNSVGFLVGISA